MAVPFSMLVFRHALCHNFWPIDIQIKQRLEPYRDKDPLGSFASLVTLAYFDRINLTAHGFFEVGLSLLAKVHTLDHGLQGAL
jgi:hypothetical protein